MEKIKKTLALTLRLFAEELDNIKTALKRLEDYDDDDFSPSKYTPSRNMCKENLRKLHGTIDGYCLAVDNVLGLDSGTTKGNFFMAMHNKKHLIGEYPAIDQDSGYGTAAKSMAESKAIETFQDAIFDNDQYKLSQ